MTSDLVERNASIPRQGIAESDVATVKITTRDKNILIRIRRSPY